MADIANPSVMRISCTSLLSLVPSSAIFEQKKVNFWFKPLTPCSEISVVHPAKITIIIDQCLRRLQQEQALSAYQG